MPVLPLDPEGLRRELARYTPGEERSLRNRQAALGEDATRPALNAFFRERLAGRRFGRAIDLGCHNGAFAEAVLAPVSDALVVCDFAEGALTEAARRLPDAKAVRFDLAGTWPDQGRFDLVALCEVIQHMPDAAARERAFDRAAALLTPGGVLIHSGYFLPPGEPADGFFRSDRWAERLFFHRSSKEEAQARFARNSLAVTASLREELAEAFLLQARA